MMYSNRRDDPYLGAIRAEMARRRVLQRDLAEALGISQQAMSNRLCGITPITQGEHEAIAGVLGCAPEDLEPSHV